MLLLARIVTYLAAGLGALLLIGGVGSATGAPQEAAIAAMICALVFIPYAVTATAQRARLINLAERAERERVRSGRID